MITQLVLVALLAGANSVKGRYCSNIKVAVCRFKPLAGEDVADCLACPSDANDEVARTSCACILGAATFDAAGTPARCRHPRGVSLM